MVLEGRGFRGLSINEVEGNLAWKACVGSGGFGNWIII